MRLRSRILALAALLPLVLGLVVGLGAPTTQAAAGQVFPVMNTSETPPDGVWFRNSPHQGDTNRETGFGVYAGESMQVDCYSIGDAVGPYSNHIWYRGLDVSRPTINGHSNYGYMNTHYVNDGMVADHAHPGVPDCDSVALSQSPKAKVTPVSSALVYFSPFNKGAVGVNSCSSWCNRSLDMNDSSVRPIYLSQWAPTYPKPSSTVCTEDSKSSSYKQVTSAGSYPQTLAGWSLGRLGVEFSLLKSAHNAAELQSLSYILLIDPGKYDDLTCDRKIHAGDAYANWLLLNPSARLVVISADQSQLGNSKGVQESYFNSIRYYAQINNANIRSRVLICNYSLNHYGAYFAGRYWVSHRIGASTSSCPWLSSNGVTYKPTAGWHP